MSKQKTLVVQAIDNGVLLLKVVSYRRAMGKDNFPVVETVVRLDTNEEVVKNALESLGWNK